MERNSLPGMSTGRAQAARFEGYRWPPLMRFWPAWLRDHWGLVGSLFAAGVLLYLLWMIFPAGGGPEAATLANLTWISVSLFAALCLWRMAALPAQEAVMRRVWTAFALGLTAIFLSGQLHWMAGRSPQPGGYNLAADLFYLAYYPFILAGLVLLPGQPLQRAGRAKFWLNLAIVMVAAWLPVWYYLIGPGLAVWTGSQEGFIAYPVAGLVLVAGLAHLLLRHPNRIPPGLRLLILGGLAFSLAGSFIYSSQRLAGTYTRGGWAEVTWVASCLFWALAALRARQVPAVEAEEFPENQLSKRVAALLPVLASVLAFFFVITELVINLLRGQSIAGLLSTGSLLAGLVMLAYILELSGNQHLERELLQSKARLQLFTWEHEQSAIDREQDIPLAAKVGQRLSKLSDLDSLLKDTVSLLHERFSLYYVQVYLVDTPRRKLVLQAGSGAVGQDLLQRNHQLPVNLASIPGTAAAEKRPVIVGDTSNSLIYQSNPLLPDTRSEMAIPLLLDDQLVGILDMQSAQPETFTVDRLPAFESVAGRLAVAIANSRLFAEVEQAREGVLAQARRLTRRNWQDYLNALERSEYLGYSCQKGEITRLESPPANLNDPAARGSLEVPIQVLGEAVGKFHLELDEPCSPEQVELANAIAVRVAQQAENLRLLGQAELYQAQAEQAVRRLTRQGWNNFLEASHQPLGYLYDENSVIAWEATDQEGYQPLVGFNLIVHGETIGELSLAGVEGLDEQASATLENTARLLSEHLENLRLYSSAQQELAERRRAEETLVKRATELATVARLSKTVTALTDRLQIMQMVVDLAREAFQLYHAHIYSLDSPTRKLILSAGAGQVGRQMVAQGWEIPLDRKQSLVARAARTHQGVIVNDVRLEPDFLPNPLLPDTRAEMAVPILAGERVLGVLDVQSSVAGRFTQEDIDIQTTLAAQVAVALENARLFQQVQRQADQEALINSISQKIQSTTTVETALQVAIREIGRALGAQRTSVHLDLARKAPTIEQVEATLTPSNGKDEM